MAQRLLFWQRNHTLRHRITPSLGPQISEMEPLNPPFLSLYLILNRLRRRQIALS